jgi:serine/threonine protein phosphatase PrpC
LSGLWLLTGASVIGPGHDLEGTPNQDAFLNRQLSGGFLSVVCDGMGSKPNSHVGSRLACRAVYEVIRNVEYGIDSQFLVNSVYSRWLTLLDGSPENDAVTTCLICWGNSSGSVRYFQLGDGRIVAPKHFIENESANFSNETTGFGISTSFSDWRTGEFVLNRGQCVAIMTDGISEDLQLGCEGDLLAALTQSLKGRSSRRSKKVLVEELQDWPTPNHLDDKTISVVVRL